MRCALRCGLDPLRALWNKDVRGNLDFIFKNIPLKFEMDYMSLEECILCDACAPEFVNKVISVWDYFKYFQGDFGKAYMITEECILCGTCVPECPNEAITADDPVLYYRLGEMYRM